MFGNIKNPELSGDFEIKIRVGKQKLSAWLNVPFLVQIAHLHRKWDKNEEDKDCIGNHFEEYLKMKSHKFGGRSKELRLII